MFQEHIIKSDYLSEIQVSPLVCGLIKDNCFIFLQLYSKGLCVLILPEQIQRIHRNKHGAENNNDRACDNRNRQFLSKE